MRAALSHKCGFTLIELSIVLVIIGLIVGGVLVGRDLIRAAEVRATVSQIEKYSTAVNTFRDKYGALPGDIPAGSVTSFGFTTTAARAGTQGRGDGNGLIEGYNYGTLGSSGLLQTGETAFFWEDLSSNSHLIDQTFVTATDAALGAAITNLSTFLPISRLGGTSYLYVFSFNGDNYFGLTNGTQIATNGALYVSMGLTVAQAYLMDRKIDDGLPLAGNVQASFVDGPTLNFAPSDIVPAFYTCYDTTSNRYSMTINGGAYSNCALTFRMK